MVLCSACGKDAPLPATVPSSSSSKPLCAECAGSRRKMATLILSGVLLAMVVAIGLVFYRAFTAGR